MRLLTIVHLSLFCHLLSLFPLTPEKVSFRSEKVTFSREKMTFTILKVTFSDEKVVFSEHFSREFNRKVYLLGKACQASIAKDHLFLANGHPLVTHHLFLTSKYIAPTSP